MRGTTARDPARRRAEGRCPPHRRRHSSGQSGVRIPARAFRWSAASSRSLSGPSRRRRSDTHWRSDRLRYLAARRGRPGDPWTGYRPFSHGPRRSRASVTTAVEPPPPERFPVRSLPRDVPLVANGRRYGGDSVVELGISGHLLDRYVRAQCGGHPNDRRAPRSEARKRSCVRTGAQLGEWFAGRVRGARTHRSAWRARCANSGGMSWRQLRL